MWSVCGTSCYEVPLFVGKHNGILTEIGEALWSQYFDVILTEILFIPFVGKLPEIALFV